MREKIAQKVKFSIDKSDMETVGEKKRGERKVKWECVEVGHHKNVGRTIEEWEKNGWVLHIYTAAGNPGAISHYLLFKKNE